MDDPNDQFGGLNKSNESLQDSADERQDDNLISGLDRLVHRNKKNGDNFGENVGFDDYASNR